MVQPDVSQVAAVDPIAALANYREHVQLDEPFLPPASPTPPTDVTQIAGRLVQVFAAEPAAPQREDIDRFVRVRGPHRALQALLTVRPPQPLPDGTDDDLHTLFAAHASHRHRVEPTTIPTIAAEPVDTSYPAASVTSLWQGDITTLAVDAITNAANSALLGCFRVDHPCIDNAVHAAAGPWLRADCARIVDLQGHDEPTGTAKITRGYHLPARFVLHTVGPIARGAPTPHQADQLATCYRSCLELAATIVPIRTVAFCAVSTGVFGYPRPAAATVALDAVARWVDDHPGRFDRIVFDLFSDDDIATYRHALAGWGAS